MDEEVAVAIGFAGKEAPQYSTDLAAAFLVLNRLHDLGFDIEVHRSNLPGIPWCVTLGMGDLINGEVGRAWGDSVPDAICRAALQAFEWKAKQ